MDTVWTVLHTLWTGLWEAVDSAVGDTPEDVHMGKNAGVFSVGILSQYVDDRRLRESEPDVLLNAIEELPTVFG